MFNTKTDTNNIDNDLDNMLHSCNLGQLNLPTITTSTTIRHKTEKNS